MAAPGIANADFTARHLRRRYLVALSLIALLTLVSQVVIQFSIADQEHDSRVVNIAGRQRMLSQKIAKTCYYLTGANSQGQRQEFIGQLQQAQALWERSHVGLQLGDAGLGLPGRNSAAVAALFLAIEPQHQAMLAAVKEILARPDDLNVLRQATARISQNEPDFLRGMDAIVFRYDAEAHQRVNFAKLLEMGLAGVTLLVLVLEAGFIFAPAVRRLHLDMLEREQREADMEKLFSVSPNAMFLIDETSLEIVRCNLKAEHLMGCRTDELLRLPIGNFLDPKHDTNLRFLEKLRAGNTLDEYEVLLIDAKHSVVEALASACSITFGGRQVYLLGITNITELKRAQQTLQHYATFDDMTGLVNRRTGLLLLEKEVERARRNAVPLAVCYVDLDGLKSVNDEYGHHEGDWMIRTISKIMSDSIRKGDVAIRLGGDEFLLVLHDCPEQEAGMLVERIENRLAEVSSSQAKPFALKASIGRTAFDPLRHANIDELVADADQRMYAAKQLRKAGNFSGLLKRSLH